VLELVRRIDFAVHPVQGRIDKEGPVVWAELEAADGTSDDLLLGLLQAMVDLDRLGDTLADWALDRAGKHPEDEVDATTAKVGRHLDEIGAPREERERPPRGRG
jgi:hypothetical protein